MPPKKPVVLGTPWGFSSLWNQALSAFPERPLQKRSHIWASEMGRPYVDRYLKMHAYPYSNPPNERSKRKFIAGHFFEWVAGLVLTMVGVLKQRQLRGEVELPGLLKVTGKLDYVAGGAVDWEKAKAEVKRIQELFAVSIDEMPAFILHAVVYILSAMQKQFENKPLKEMIVEVKSVSSFMSEKLEKTGKAMPHHVLQVGHYLIADNNLDEAKLIYLCKDDMISHEFSVLNSKELKKYYLADVKGMTDVYNATNHKNILKTMPPKAPEVYFTEGVWRFEKNFDCEYSPYLTFLYQYATPEEFRYKWAKSLAAWNRVFKRCVKGETMTPSNKTYIQEASKAFPEWDKYVLKARLAGAFQTGEENEDE